MTGEIGSFQSAILSQLRRHGAIYPAQCTRREREALDGLVKRGLVMFGTTAWSDRNAYRQKEEGE